MVRANICPMVNQIEYHPGFTQKECVEFCQKNNILVEAWSPLGRGNVLDNPLLKSIAANHNKSVAQVVILVEYLFLSIYATHIMFMRFI